VTGSIDNNLVKALNVSVDRRIEQILANIGRLRSAKISYSGTQLVANIPEYKLHVYEDGREVFDMAIVVGKESTKTVVFNGNISQIVFSPYWNVPPSIVENEILPAMRGNKNYLKNNGYEVVGREGGLPAIRQKPGAGNSLGKVKFVFPNSHNIYLHDTPAKSIFKMDQRAYSHGCIRVAEPAKLAAYLLRNESSWSAERIRKAMDAGSPQVVKLDNSVPVAITYFTAWVDEDGVMNFREDIYGRDKVSNNTISGVALNK
jgi:murein L,D-transpeptidase YcbB/YkuD